MKKMSFCESCATEEGIMDLSGFGIADSVMAPGTPSAPAGDAGEACPGCGFTKGKFQQTGRLGCSECYLIFSEEILARLGPMHRGLRHFGKHPEGFVGDAFSDRLLVECKERLEQAVSAENYEEAARIRDEIRQLEIGRETAGSAAEPSAEQGDEAT